MRTIYILVILVLLALAVPASPAHAGGVVTVCDEAHLLAALAGGGTVTFTCSGTITLTATIVILADTTIDGSGQTVTISGNNAVRVFVVNEGVTLNLNRLTVANGYVHGNDDNGGGIYNLGTLMVTNSRFSNNDSHCDHYCDGGGGGIANLGTLIVTNSRFSDNRATCDFYCTGGGIANGGTLIVVGSIFSGNSAYDGGGIGSVGTLTVSSSTFFDNDAAYGGGIYNNGTLTISGSTFSDNYAGGGGGIHTYSGHVNVSNSTFFDNDAAWGGGISDLYGTVAVTNSTFCGNIGSAGQNGGAINAFLLSGHTFTLKNTIVANSPEGVNCAGPITDGGGNLTYPDTTCPGVNADPLLGPLHDNGGPTWTMALGEGSAAIDAADDTICAAPPVNNLDQRGFPRPWGVHCDIGAVEQIQEPSAVSVSALRAQSLPGTITPAMVAGLLLAVLVAVGVRRRPCHVG
jgi:hypothetical protein